MGNCNRFLIGIKVRTSVGLSFVQLSTNEKLLDLGIIFSHPLTPYFTVVTLADLPKVRENSQGFISKFLIKVVKFF